MRRALIIVLLAVVPAAAQDELGLPPLDAGDGLVASVDAARGDLRLREEDAPGLVRTRVSGAVAHGPFGRGWRLEEAGERFVLERDAVGRVARAWAHEVELRYEYDAQGELVAVRGARVREYRVESGFVLGVAGPRGELLTVAHDDLGRVATLRTPGGARGFAFAADRATVTAGEERWTCALDANGRITHVEHAWPGSRAVATRSRGALVVDTPWGRFERARGELSGPFGTIRLERADGGRRVTFPGGVVAPVLRRDPVDHRFVLEHGGGRTSVERRGVVETWTTDRAGRLVAAGDLRLRHDAARRVVAIEGPPGEGAEPVVGYAWDGAGRLARVERHDDRGTTAVDYGWTDDGRLGWRRDAAGLARVVETWLVRAVSGADGRVRLDVLDPDGGAPLATLGPDGWRFLHADADGTVVAATDATGALVAEVELSSTGEVVFDPGRELPLFWRGAELDRAAGLALVRGRPYAPSLARFLAPEPARAGTAAYTPGLVGALR